jgi:hypothetical protein
MTGPLLRFVSYDLDTSIDVAQKLWDNRGDGSASNNELAELLGYKSANNGAFLTRVANARLFKVLEGPASALRVSPLALRILHPEYPDDAAAARIEAFEGVPLFKAVLDRYHGQVLPTEDGFRNALQTQFGINEDKASFVATRLLDSAQQAGLFSVAGSRTKMIRPTFGSGGSRRPAPAAQTPETPAPSVTPATPLPVNPSLPRSQKVIDGVLDMLPPKDDCSEEQLTQWLEFFESALRMFYSLPKAGVSAP